MLNSCLHFLHLLNAWLFYIYLLKLTFINCNLFGAKCYFKKGMNPNQLWQVCHLKIFYLINDTFFIKYSYCSFVPHKVQENYEVIFHISIRILPNCRVHTKCTYFVKKKLLTFILSCFPHSLFRICFWHYYNWTTLSVCNDATSVIDEYGIREINVRYFKLFNSLNITLILYCNLCLCLSTNAHLLLIYRTVIIILIMCVNLIVKLVYCWCLF